MNERYSRLFSLSQNLYAKGSPVIIAAGALLKDNQTGKVLVQLKLKSLSCQPIKAATVVVKPFDTAGKPLGENITYQYLDLKVDRDGEFGQKAPIAMPDAATRAFEVAVSEVVFQTNSIWESNDTCWESLPDPVPLREILNDTELLKQYQLKFGTECSYGYQEIQDLWYCPCGEINHKGEPCGRCGTSSDTFSRVDMEALATERDKRVAQEKKEAAERLDRQRKEAEKKEAEDRARAAKIKKVAAVVIPTVAICVAGVLLTTKVILPAVKYNSAVTLMENRQYEEAIEAFEALNGYRDSVTQIKSCKTGILDRQYNSAVLLMEEGRNEEAISIFQDLDAYRDSEEQIVKCQYAYVLDHQDATDMKTYEYLKNLKEQGYRDSVSIYSLLYALNATLEVEPANDKNVVLGNTLMANIYYTITGGTPEKSINIRMEIERYSGGFSSVIKRTATIQAHEKGMRHCMKFVVLYVGKNEIYLYNDDTGDLLTQLTYYGEK